MLINFLLFLVVSLLVYAFGSLMHKVFFLKIYNEKFDENFFSNLFFGLFFI